VGSDWLELPQILDMLDAARAGDRQRLDEYLAESRLRCTSPDCASLVVARWHLAYFVEGKGWAQLNAPPEPDGQARQVIVLHDCMEGGIGASSLPVPFERRIVAVAWHEEHWVLQLEDGEVRSTPLQLARAMGDSSYDGFFVEETTIARNFNKIDGSVPIEHLGPPVDWAAIRVKLPSTIEDGVLGVLTRGSAGMEFTTTVDAFGRRVNIVVSVDAQGSWETALRRAAALVERLDTHVAAVREHATRQLLELKNGTWLEEGEPPVSADAFQQLMQLEGLTFYDDGSVVFHFEDGESAERSGLFWGHAIVVSMSSDDGLSAARIEG
jgi:hypothetical protein